MYKNMYIELKGTLLSDSSVDYNKILRFFLKTSVRTINVILNYSFGFIYEHKLRKDSRVLVRGHFANNGYCDSFHASKIILLGDDNKKSYIHNGYFED